LHLKAQRLDGNTPGDRTFSGKGVETIRRFPGSSKRSEFNSTVEQPHPGAVLSRDVALQVAFERQTLKPFFSLDRL
jgi:hypothetical protein